MILTGAAPEREGGAPCGGTAFYQRGYRTAGPSRTRVDARNILEEGDEELSLAQTVHRRLNQPAAISSDAVALTRLPLTPQHFQAEALVTGWMEKASLQVRRDAAGNLVVRLEGSVPDASAVVLGSRR